MNLENFNDFLIYQDVSTGNVLAYYDFENYSGQYLRNELNTGMFNDGCVDPRDYPGLVSCIDTGDFFSSAGSGYFDGSATLRISDEMTSSEFTLFVNFSYENNSTGTPKVLMSNIGSGFSGSGFYVYINDSNRLNIEYEKNGRPFCATLEKELGNKNIVSIAKTSRNSLIDIAYHDIINRENTYLAINPRGYSNSTKFTIGNVSFENSVVTGLSGYVDNIALLNTYLPVSKRNEIAKSFVSTGINVNEFDFTTENFNVVESIVFENQATGTGITGYTQVGTKNVNLRCGSPIELCDLSGVTGELSGYVATIIEGSDTISVTSSSVKAITVQYDTGYLQQFNYYNLLFTPAYGIDSDDTYEIYKHTVFDARKNNTPVYVRGVDAFRLDLDYASQDINFYYNGLLQHSGESVSGVVSNDWSLQGIDVDSDSFFTSYNSVIYDKISGSSYYSGFNDEDQSSIIMEITSVDLTTKDVYYNGKKLVSGLDYQEHPIFGSDTVELFLSGHGTGYIYFYPKYEATIQITGSGSKTVELVDGINNMQAWINGIRQVKNQDYLLLRSDSLLLSQNTFENYSNLIYNNYSTNFGE